MQVANNNFGSWVSVNDSLPKNRGVYLVSIDPNYAPDDGSVLLVDMFVWDGDEWQTMDYDFYDGEEFKIIVDEMCPVVAWMDLPNPYLIIDKKSGEIVKLV